MDNKTRELFIKYGIPTVPEYDEFEKDDPELRKYARDWHEANYKNLIFILKNKLHMSDSDMKLYFTSKEFIDDDYYTRRDALKDYSVKEKYYTSGYHYGFEENEYILYENKNHLILDHRNYIEGSGTDHYTTVIR